MAARTSHHTGRGRRAPPRCPGVSRWTVAAVARGADHRAGTSDLGAPLKTAGLAAPCACHRLQPSPTDPLPSSERALAAPAPSARVRHYVGS